MLGDGLDSAWILQRLCERYEHPAEVAAYTEQVTEGLRPEEEAALARWLPTPCRVLDLGCGAGREAFVLAERGYQVVAADISQAMVEKTRQLATERGLQLAVVWMEDPLRIPVPTAAFDCVLGLAQLLSQIPRRRGRVALLKEVCRVLVATGVFIGTVADRQAASDLCGDESIAELSPLERAAGWEEGDIWVWQPSAAKIDTALYFHLHTPGEISWELRQAGLRLRELRMANELAAHPSTDAYRYRFIVAGKRRKEISGEENRGNNQ